MAKSVSNVSFERHGLENDDQNDDQQATTSKGSALKADNTFDNMDDLEPMDFNSADTMRQTMKAIFAGRVPPPYLEEVNNSHGQDTSALIKANELARNQFHPMGQYVHSVNPSRTMLRGIQNRFKEKRRNKTDKRYVAGPSKVERRGRPRRAAPKKIITISDMFLGKLSNVVPFKRRWQSETDSDLESAELY